MSTDIENRIKRIEETVEENNEILRKIRRKEVFNFWFNIIKIMILVGVFYYGYTLLQPFLDQAWSSYQEFKGAVETVSELKDKLNIGIQGLNPSELFDR